MTKFDFSQIVQTAIQAGTTNKEFQSEAFGAVTSEIVAHSFINPGHTGLTDYTEFDFTMFLDHKVDEYTSSGSASYKWQYRESDQTSDAFINFTSGDFPGSAPVTTGSPTGFIHTAGVITSGLNVPLELRLILINSNTGEAMLDFGEFTLRPLVMRVVGDVT